MAERVPARVSQQEIQTWVLLTVGIVVSPSRSPLTLRDTLLGYLTSRQGGTTRPERARTPRLALDTTSTNWSCQSITRVILLRLLKSQALVEPTKHASAYIKQQLLKCTQALSLRPHRNDLSGSRVCQMCYISVSKNEGKVTRHMPLEFPCVRKHTESSNSLLLAMTPKVHRRRAGLID